MSSMIRTLIGTPRARLFTSLAVQPRRFAHQSYGNRQSGHEQGLHEKNPKEHLEHPGPEAPATQGKTGSGQSSQQPQGSSASSSGGQPTIQTPKSAAEDSDPEVRKHNEEMAQRADRSVNQLREEDNKVDKNFWKGDVGDIRDDKK